MLRRFLRLLSRILAFLPLQAVTLLAARRSRRVRVVATLDLDGPLREDGSFGRPGAASQDFAGLLALLADAAADASVRAVALRVGRLGAGWGQVEELVAQIAALRTQGRKVFAYLDHPSHAELTFGAACDHVTLPPLGTLDVLGLRAEVTFLGDALDRLGVVPHFVSAGDFKSYGETFTRRDMSPEHRTALDHVLAALHASFIAGVARGRKMTPDRVQALVDGGPHSADEAVAAGLVDAALYPDGWRKEIRRQLGESVAEGEEDAVPPPRDAHRFERAVPWLWLVRLRRRLHRVVWPRPTVVVLTLDGSIVDSSAAEVGAGRIAPRPVNALLAALRKDDEVAAVVLRINSPGGSGLASDMIWRELRRLGERKPLVASMGNVAASGGYYLAMAAKEILADANTITGSIGVVAGKFDLSGLLGRVGVTHEVLSYGVNSGLNSALSGLTAAENARFQEHVEAFYRAFVGKAAECRGVEVAVLEPHARGRIWTGAQAKEHGLIDGLGGLQDAVRRAAIAAHLGGEYDLVVVHPPRPGWRERFGRLAGLSAAGPELDLRALWPRLEAEAAAGAGPQLRLPFDLRIL